MHNNTLPDNSENNPHQHVSAKSSQDSHLSRRHFLSTFAGIATVSAGGIGYALYKESAHEETAHAAALLGSTILFGNSQSESTQNLQQTNTYVDTNTLGISCRRSNPQGSLTFQVTCDALKQNYLTLKLWGSDASPNGGQILLTAIDGTDLSAQYIYGTDHPELDRMGSQEAFPGRFFYVTELLPLALTQGKQQISITLKSAGDATPYNLTNPTAPQVGPSRGLYRATVHTDPFFVPATNEVIGSAPAAGKPLQGPSGVSQYDYAKQQFNAMVSILLGWQLYGPQWDQQVASSNAPAMMTGALIHGGLAAQHVSSSWTKQQWKDTLYVAAVSYQNDTNANYLTILAHAYLESWSSWYHNPELLDRVLRGLDFYCVAQGSNGGFHDGDRYKKWIGAPQRQLAYNPLEGLGDQYLGEAFVMLYDLIKGKLSQTIDSDDDPTTPAISRQQAYTQLFKANRQYVSGNRGHAPNQDLGEIWAIYWANEALKLLSPADVWPDQQMLTYLYSASGLAPDVYGGHWFSSKGMPLEALGSSAGGYACDYGVSNVRLISTLAAQTRDTHITAMAQKVVQAMAYFYYIWNDENGHVNLADDAIVAWRNNYDAPYLSYGGGTFGAASLYLKSPAAIRQAQLYLAHNQVYAINTQDQGSHFLDNVIQTISVVSNWQQISALPAATPLPMEAASPDFAWADEQAAAVVVKRNKSQERLYISLNWRHSAGNPRSPQNATANNIARIHHTTPMIDRVATIVMQSIPGYMGLYQASYGNYMIAMNASQDKTYTITIPQGQKTLVEDLISQKTYKPGHQYTLQPQTTVVWYLG